MNSEDVKEMFNNYTIRHYLLNASARNKYGQKRQMGIEIKPIKNQIKFWVSDESEENELIFSTFEEALDAWNDKDLNI